MYYIYMYKPAFEPVKPRSWPATLAFRQYLRAYAYASKDAEPSRKFQMDSPLTSVFTSVRHNKNGEFLNAPV